MASDLSRFESKGSESKIIGAHTQLTLKTGVPIRKSHVTLKDIELTLNDVELTPDEIALILRHRKMKSSGSRVNYALSELLEATEDLSSERYVLPPDSEEQDKKFYKTQEENIWHVNEVDMADDIKHYEVMISDEKEFLEALLSYFAPADGVVLEIAAVILMVKAKTQWRRAFYAVQQFIETVHAETYTLMIDVLVKDKDKKKKLFSSMENRETVRNKNKWVRDKMGNPEASDGELLAVAAINEGVFFSASFAGIFYFRSRGKLPGVCMGNDLISKDEGLHTEFSVYQYQEEKLSDTKIHALFEEAMKLEEAFVRDALKVNLPGLTTEDLVEYSKFTADHVLMMLGHPPLFRAKMKIEYMNMISLQGKTNFFEKRVPDYNLNVSKDDAKVVGVDLDVDV